METAHIKSVVALMHQDRPARTFQVADDSGRLYVKPSRGAGSQTWQEVHPGLNPDLDTYLDRCASSFGWTIERLALAS